LALNTYTRDITPDPSLLPKSGKVGYSIPEAIGELVDNEIDARIAGELLNIEIYIGQRQGGMIQVKGNGSGMDGETLASALRLGYSTRPPEAIGEFGLGLKTACTNLGKAFEIVTVPVDGDRGFKVSYNEEQFLAKGAWEIQIDEIEKPFEHGTVVTITSPNVNIYGGVADVAAIALGRIFRHYIKSEQVEIIVNDTPVAPHEWDLLDDYTVPFDFEINGKKVWGWYGLQKKASQKTGYGFELIRRNRIMKRHDKLGFRPHPKLAMLAGELHLDDFPVTANKTDFIRETPDWVELEDQMRETVRPVVEMASRKYQSKLNPRDEVRATDVKDKTETAVRSEEFARTLDNRLLSDALRGDLERKDVEKRAIGESEPPAKTNGQQSKVPVTEPDTEEPKRPRTPKEVHQVLRRTRTQLLSLNIEHVPVKFGPDAAYKSWDVDGLGEHKRIVVSSNLDHPMFAAFDDTVTWVKHNIAEAVAEYLAAETLEMAPAKVPVADVMKLKSDILRFVSELQMAEELEEVHA
jgi:Histidine kinase-, DNA gyrase B-, and HSP90-like ATPase